MNGFESNTEARRPSRPTRAREAVRASPWVLCATVAFCAAALWLGAAGCDHPVVTEPPPWMYPPLGTPPGADASTDGASGDGSGDVAADPSPWEAQAEVDAAVDPDTEPAEGGDAADEQPVSGDADAHADADSSAPSADCQKLAQLDADLAVATTDAQRLALVDAFLAAVQLSEGLPVRCGPNVTFLVRIGSSLPSAPHVAGDFNAFDPNAAPMTLIAGDAYRATLDVEQGPKRFKYKYTAAGQWKPDPLARRFGFDAYGEYSLVSGGTLQGHLERHPPLGGAGLEPRPLSLYVPPGYEAATDSYPVLYAHDGQNLFDPAAPWGGWKLDAAIEQLLAQGKIQPLIVVGIHNSPARMDEYTHVQDKVGGKTVGGKAEAYFDLIRTVVAPAVQKRYRLKTGPASTWTMGSSLGGLVSLYFGMKHPDVFGRVAGLSSTAGWGSIEVHNETIIELLPKLGKPAVVFYLDSGGSDGGGCVDADSDGIRDDNPNAGDNYCETVQMRDVMASAGYQFGVDLVHWHEPGAAHNEAAWAARVGRPLAVLAAK